MRQNPDFVVREINAELVLVPVTRQAADLESLFTLNEVGGRIWRLIETCDTAQEIAQQIANEYEVEEADALVDVEELLQQLREVRAVMDE